MGFPHRTVSLPGYMSVYAYFITRKPRGNPSLLTNLAIPLGNPPCIYHYPVGFQELFVTSTLQSPNNGFFVHWAPISPSFWKILLFLARCNRHGWCWNTQDPLLYPHDWGAPPCKLSNHHYHMTLLLLKNVRRTTSKWCKRNPVNVTIQ